MTGGGTGRRRPLEALLPARLGRDVRWLFGSVLAGNLGDGVLLAAGPLLVASLTRDPFLVASAVTVQRLPWLLLSLPAGAWVDRVDRRRVVVAVDLARAAVVALLAMAVATGVLTVPLLYAALLALGTAEVVGDSAGLALTGELVPRDDLGFVNSRLVAAFQLTNQLAGPALGAALFAAAAPWPFATTAVLLLVAGGCITRTAPRPTPAATGPRRLRSEVAEGLRWLRGNAPVRRLLVLLTLFNVSFGAAFALWVLYALERLGLGDAGFGALLSVSAVGGLAGAAAYPRLARRFGDTTLLRAGLVLETCSHAALALTTTAWVAGVVFLLFGAHTAVWGSLSRTIRLRAVPDRLQGRVQGIGLLGGMGTLVVGSAIGGVLADAGGVLAPFWFAFALAAATTAWTWRSVDEIGRAGTAGATDTGRSPTP